MSDGKPTIRRAAPEFLHNKPHFANLVESSGGRRIDISGLVASTAEGKLVAPGDLAGQMAFIYESIRKTLATVDATPANVVRQRIFIVNLQLDHRPIIMKAMTDFYGEEGLAASTCVGVDALLVEGALVEIDVTAVVAEP